MVHLFSNTNSEKAHEELLDFVEQYFFLDSTEAQSKVNKTNRPPIFLQQPGHSITIIGIERFKDQSRNLLVFDPSFGPSDAMKSLLTTPASALAPKTKVDNLLRPYRRSASRLSRYAAFEMLGLVPASTLPI